MIRTYKNSGVDISKSDSFLKTIKPYIRKTFTANVVSDIGNFSGLFELNLKGIRKPVLISSIDGVGTKLKLALMLNKLDGIGEDLVNHCVNDIAVCGAKPLFFLDYYATGKLNKYNSIKVLKSLVNGCIKNNIALIGGETAEMPGIYAVSDFDLAGCIVGIADKNNLVDFRNVKRKDVLIGLESSGIHTNGFSLIRKIFNTEKKLKKYYREINNYIGSELLKVHRSYLKIIRKTLSNYKINAISHITGGGIIGNTIRVIPEGCNLSIDWNSWRRPFLFELIKQEGKVSEKEMRKIFNLGIGLIFIISPENLDSFINFLYRNSEKGYVIGEVC